jgi:predicted SprT family Zn-dependent metalloprotease
MSHEFTVEVLYHFNCGECKNWWSYATTRTNKSMYGKYFHCPHCGHETDAKLKENFFEKKT